MSQELQHAIDRLIYNQLYAPNYPAEDKTSLAREQSQILAGVDKVTAKTQNESVLTWLKLGRLSITEAFAKLENEAEKNGRRDLESAIRYLRNARARKPLTSTSVAVWWMRFCTPLGE